MFAELKIVSQIEVWQMRKWAFRYISINIAGIHQIGGHNPNQDPIGQQISIGDLSESRDFATIVGIVPTIVHDRIDAESHFARAYTPFAKVLLWWLVWYCAERAIPSPSPVR